MTKLESAVVGYISGAIVGGLVLIFIVGWILVKEGEMTPPEFVTELYTTINTQFHQPHPTWFEVAFLLGFLSGISGGGSAAHSANNRRKNTTS